MIGLTLKHLRYFEALATHGHFGHAAAACSISQPALSLQIKELEGLFGGPLVERAAREIRLTALGEDLLDRAKEILVRVEDLEGLVRSSSGPMSGRLRLGIIPTVAPYLLPQIIKAFADDAPDLELQPRESVTNALIEDLLASRLDFALMALPISEPALQELPLFEEEFLLVRPSSDAEAPPPSPTSLQTMRLLLLEEGHCFRDQALAYCDLSGAKPRQIMEGNSLTTLVQLVGAGIGVTLIPEMAERFETRSADVSITRFEQSAPKRTIGMIWRKTNPLGERLRDMGDIVRAAAAAKGVGTGAPSARAS